MTPVVALATPWGRAALAVLRASAPTLDGLVGRWLIPLGDRPLAPGGPRRVSVRGANGAPVDDGVACWRRGPATFTGEDTLEVTIHGNPLVVDAALAGALAAGARLADPGEFSLRAVLAGKMDLLAAEATDQLVRAVSPAGVAVARRGLAGEVRAAVDPLYAGLLDAAAELEARLDYPADELALETDEALVARLEDVSARCAGLSAEAERGRLCVDGARVALVGAVNAGKSSLFNRLVGSSRALVHETAGTTRDVLEIACRLGPLEVVLLDTAGERETDDPVEAAGLALARELVADADLLVVVLRASPSGAPDAAEAILLARTADHPRVLVCNGVDKPGVVPVPGAIPASMITGEGLEAIASAVRSALGAAEASSPVRLGSARQRDLLAGVGRLAKEAAFALPVAGPAVSAELVTAALAEIDALVGRDPREEVLSALFRRFCIGK